MAAPLHDGVMSSLVPRLVPRPPSPVLRLLGAAVRGIRAMTDQIEPYTAWWDEQNQQAANGSGPLLVAIGDSTAIGIGATAPANGYVGLLAGALSAGAPRQVPWRTINLGLSGARLEDALDRQLPILDDLATRGLEPQAVVCCIGTNDLVWGREVTKLQGRLATLAAGLPSTAVVGTLAGASARGRLANRALRNAADERGLRLVDPWAEPNPGTGQRLAADRFHPSDLGYQLMAVPFAKALDAEPFLDRPALDPDTDAGPRDS